MIFVAPNLILLELLLRQLFLGRQLDFIICLLPLVVLVVFVVIFPIYYHYQFLSILKNVGVRDSIKFSGCKKKCFLTLLY